MKRTIAPWTIAIATATILAMPLSGLAQTPQQTPPQTPPPTPSQPEQRTTQPAPQTDASKDAAKAHLTAARNSLSQITQMPAAGQLQGETRAQVSQLINNFNELITTKAEWKASFAKVESNVDALLAGSATAEPGKPAAAGELDPAIRGKLVEFREHLTKFEQAASGAPSEPAAAPSAPPTAQTPPPTPPPDTPAQTPPPNQPQPPANQPQLPPNQPEPTTPPQQDDRSTANPEELLQHIEAIEAIIGAQAAAQAAQSAQNPVGTTGTPSGSTRTTVTGREIMLTPEQVQQLRTHLAEIRRLIAR